MNEEDKIITVVEKSVEINELIRFIGELCCTDCQARLRSWLAPSIRVGVSTLASQIPLIIEVVAEETGIPVSTITGRDNRTECVCARRKVVKQARAIGCTLPEIGAALNKHHTTILHLLNTLDRRLPKERIPSLDSPPTERIVAGHLAVHPHERSTMTAKKKPAKKTAKRPAKKSPKQPPVSSMPVGE